MANVSHLNSVGVARYYILDASRHPVQVTEAQWRAQTRTERNIVAEDDLPGGRVWTAFTGFALDEGEERRLFSTETLIGEEGLREASYGSWAEAEAGHRQIVDRYRSRLSAGTVAPLPTGR